MAEQAQPHSQFRRIAICQEISMIRGRKPPPPLESELLTGFGLPPRDSGEEDEEEKEQDDENEPAVVREPDPEG